MNGERNHRAPGTQHVEAKPRTAEINGRLWGARAADWANIQEGTVRPVYEAVLERTRVTSGTRYLDIGCPHALALDE
jgi:hypothetical protein